MTPLEAEIRALIAAEGPLPLPRYVALCLGHPRHGYYATRDPFGAAGDFVTSPEISQVFGELLGLWAAMAWQAMGAPERVILAELGPGRGTLMADALRAARALPPFRAAVEVHLVETSPALRAVQARTLAAAEPAPLWHERVEELPQGPAIILANELLDALPFDQFVRTPSGWHARQVGLEGGRLAFGLAAEPAPAGLLPPKLRVAPVGSLVEISPEREALAATLARRLCAQGGAALLLDYGHTASAPGDTLQAMKAHAHADPLAEPGEADLTSHVDFERIAEAARMAGAAVHGPVTQRALLLALGAAERHAALLGRATPEQAARLTAGVERLIDAAPTGLGTLVKAVAIADPRLPSPPGFAERP